MTRIPIKAYVDALNLERRHTSNMRSLAIIGTLGGMIFGYLLMMFWKIRNKRLYH